MMRRFTEEQIIGILRAAQQRAKRLRDECLNEHWFLHLADARSIIEAWRIDYNSNRPHSALGYATPEDFASSHQGQAPGEMTTNARKGQTQTLELSR